MSSLMQRLSARMAAAFEAAGLPGETALVEPSRRPDLAQFQCNGVLPLAKQLRRNPREMAIAVAEALQAGGFAGTVTVDGPGFLNLTLTDAALTEAAQGLSGDARCGVVRDSTPQTVVLDFGGPNVAKAMHVGHVRSTVIGDCLQRLFRFAGHRVTSDIHMGDWGLPMGMLIAEVGLLHPDLPYFDPTATVFPEVPPVTLADLERLYPQAAQRCREDEEAMAEARAATAALQDGMPGPTALWRHFMALSTAALKEDFGGLGVSFDLWYGESTVHPRIAPMVEALRAAGHAVDSDGAVVVPVARDDDAKPMPPLILLKSDGAVMYGTTDLATVQERVESLAPDLILYVVDQRQHLHFEQVFRAASLAGLAGKAALEHIGFGTINGPDGKPYKTREGGVMRLSALVDLAVAQAAERLAEAGLAQDLPAAEQDRIARQVGIAAIKVADLANPRLTDYVFQPDKFTRFEGRTGPYLQYTAVRLRSLLARTAEAGIQAGPLVPPDRDSERALMLTLLALPEAVAGAVDKRAPHILCEHAFTLAGAVNTFYQTCPVLKEPEADRRAGWVSLSHLALDQLVLLAGLLGMDVPQRM